MGNSRIVFFFSTLWFIAAPLFVYAQISESDLPKSAYGLPVVNQVALYETIVRANPDNALVDLRGFIPHAKFDIRYAGSNNLIGRPLYPAPDMFMRRPAALALKAAAKILKKQGLGLLFHDGYRPYEITVVFYETIKDTTFVADPRKGSRHNRGMAVDLSLYDLKTGKELSMPSEYDETTPRAFHDYMDTDAASIAHRTLLRETMEAVGFDVYPWEWWHYDFKGWQSCYTYDLWHAEIRNANRRLRRS